MLIGKPVLIKYPEMLLTFAATCASNEMSTDRSMMLIALSAGGRKNSTRY
jgi:hypothetical protein